jgi:hypothetical protein
LYGEPDSVLKSNGGRAKREDAMNAKLSEQELPLNSVEGHIAHYVYGYQEGDSVFRRITLIACILIWANICNNKLSELILADRDS